MCFSGVVHVCLDSSVFSRFVRVCLSCLASVEALFERVLLFSLRACMGRGRSRKKSRSCEKEVKKRCVAASDEECYCTRGGVKRLHKEECRLSGLQKAHTHECS